jgi:hypothetical protein
MRLIQSLSISERAPENCNLKFPYGIKGAFQREQVMEQVDDGTSGLPTIYCNSGNLNPMTKTFIGKYLERYPAKSEKPTPGPSAALFQMGVHLFHLFFPLFSSLRRL